MRTLLLTVSLLLCVVEVSAQRPWGDYEPQQQERIIASRLESDLLCRALDDAASLTMAEHDEVMTLVAQRTRDRALASLYLYIYESLRHDDGSDAQADVAMITLYPTYMLELLSSPNHDYDLYNYAYAIGRYNALEEGRRGSNALGKLQKRRYRRHYGELVDALRYGVAMVENSVLLGSGVECDFTSAPMSERVAREIDAERYNAVASHVMPLAVPTYEGVETHIVEECAQWCGSYNRVVEHDCGGAIDIIHSQELHNAYFTICDSSQECYTLPAMLYITPSGRIYGVAVDQASVVECVVVGRVDRGDVTITDVIPIIEGEVIEAKCCNDELYLHLDVEAEARYLLVAE